MQRHTKSSAAMHVSVGHYYLSFPRQCSHLDGIGRGVLAEQLAVRPSRGATPTYHNSHGTLKWACSPHPASRQ